MNNNEVLTKEHLSYIESSIKKKNPIDSLSNTEALLYELFRCIDEYAKKFFILSNETENKSYDFRFNGVIYEIKEQYGPNALYTLTKKEKSDNVIEIEDVRNDSVNEKNLANLYRMKQICALMMELRNEGLEIDTIEKQMKMQIRKMRSNDGINSSK